MQITSNKIINRIFNLLILLFFATPFLFFLYSQFQQQSLGVAIKKVIETTPYLNVVFITSFVTPFIGYYMLRLKQEFDKNISREVFLVHLLIIAISFLIMGNVTYGVFVFILIYFMLFEWKVNILSVIRFFKLRNLKHKSYLAATTVLIISLGIRIMFTLVSNV